MKIEFCDLRRQYLYLKNKIDSNMRIVLSHGKFINGPEIQELEKKCSNFLNMENAIAVSSGTDALLASLLSYNVKKGDLIVTPIFNFAASAEIISLLGATPLFVDIDPKTYNIDTEKLKLLLQSSEEKIKGIIAVDLFGQPADYDEIKKITEEKNIFVIEDAAQSFGAEYKGRKACSFGDISITSFFPSKPLGCYGDGGMVFTNNKEKAEKIKQIRNHGQTSKYEHKILGLNLRFDTLQAAVLLAKLEIFEKEIKKRKEIAAKYSNKLRDLSEKGKLTLPHIKEGNTSVFAQFSILLEGKEKRDQLKEYLNENEIPTAIHYPRPLHLQEAFLHLGYKKRDFTVAEEISEKILSLPIDAWKTDEEIDYICKTTNEFFYN